MLSVSGLHSGYGRIEAVHGVDIDIAEGEVVTLIGANGAGKSTLLMTICGEPRARAGRIVFDGADIGQLAPWHIAARGIAHVPEGRRIFARMTVMENLLLGAATAPARSLDESLADVFELFPLLAERVSQRGGTLSGGEQQMLAIGRALMARPRLLLLEPGGVDHFQFFFVRHHVAVLGDGSDGVFGGAGVPDLPGDHEVEWSVETLGDFGGGDDAPAWERVDHDILAGIMRERLREQPPGFGAMLEEHGRPSRSRAGR